MRAPKRPISFKTAVGVPWPAIAIAGGFLLLSGLLFVFGRPGDAEARVAALETRLKAVQAASRTPGDLSVFPAGSVCGGKLHAAYKDQIGMALGNAGLEVEDLQLSEPERTDSQTPLNAYTVAMKAKGPYEAAVSGVSALGKFRPTLFIDSMALHNQTSAVELELKGRVFCR